MDQSQLPTEADCIAIIAARAPQQAKLPDRPATDEDIAEMMEQLSAIAWDPNLTIVEHFIIELTPEEMEEWKRTHPSANQPVDQISTTQSNGGDQENIHQ